MGKIRLTSFFSDGMILQRETENCIWGYAENSTRISCFLGDRPIVTKAMENGYFECWIPKMEAGGPWEIRISDGRESICIVDVLFGDVFLLGGQSNMELPIERVRERFEEELSDVEMGCIRTFEVPKEYAFRWKREMLTDGIWRKAVGGELSAFSAVGFFAARALWEKEKIPIGLFQTAVGGTPVKAWTSEETIRRLDLDAGELEECADASYVKQTEKKEEELEERWIAEAMLPFEEEKEKGSHGQKKKGKVFVPGFFGEGDLCGFAGSLRLKKKILLTQEKVDKLLGQHCADEEQKMGAKLYFGTVIDADQIFVNGVKIGETAYQYPPRIYPIPEGLLQEGENEIEVHMLVMRGKGGTMPGKEYGIRCGKREIADLRGVWEYEIMKDMRASSGYLGEKDFFSYKASGLYNGMLYPIRKCRFSGCFFYQGESNTGRPETYEKEFTEMIRDWRLLLGEPKLPFIYVQLAGFGDGIEHTKKALWASLREAQRRAGKTENAGMVQAYDLGEYNDLHPLDKKSVGERISLAAQALIYKKDVVWKGPEVSRVLWENDCVRVSFSLQDERLSLCAKDSKTIFVRGFEIETKEGGKFPVKAHIWGRDQVIVKLPAKQNVESLMFAWNDCPLDADLYHTAGLPAVPFRKVYGEE